MLQSSEEEEGDEDVDMKDVEAEESSEEESSDDEVKVRPSLHRGMRLQIQTVSACLVLPESKREEAPCDNDLPMLPTASVVSVDKKRMASMRIELMTLALLAPRSNQLS